MTNILKQFLAIILLGLNAAIVSLFSPAVALASSEPPVVEGHNDGLGYLLVLFCVALSIIVMARSSNRSPDMRLKELEEE